VKANEYKKVPPTQRIFSKKGDSTERGGREKGDERAWAKNDFLDGK